MDRASKMGGSADCRRLVLFPFKVYAWFGYPLLPGAAFEFVLLGASWDRFVPEDLILLFMGSITIFMVIYCGIKASTGIIVTEENIQVVDSGRGKYSLVTWGEFPAGYITRNAKGGLAIFLSKSESALHERKKAADWFVNQIHRGKYIAFHVQPGEIEQIKEITAGKITWIQDFQ